MSYEVHVLRRADLDVSEILSWLTSRSPQGAQTWLDAYLIARDELRRSAEMFPLTLQRHGLGVEVRCCPFHTPRGRTYRIYYLIDQTRMEVRLLRVQSPGQRPLRRKDLL